VGRDSRLGVERVLEPLDAAVAHDQHVETHAAPGEFSIPADPEAFLHCDDVALASALIGTTLLLGAFMHSLTQAFVLWGVVLGFGTGRGRMPSVSNARISAPLTASASASPEARRRSGGRS